MKMWHTCVWRRGVSTHSSGDEREGNLRKKERGNKFPLYEIWFVHTIEGFISNIHKARFYVHKPNNIFSFV